MAAVAIKKNSALTKKITDEFCLYFTDMTYVPGQFIHYIIFLAPSHKRPFAKMAAWKACDNL